MTKIALIGSELVARYHLERMIEQDAEVAVIYEPASNNYELTL